MKNLPAKTTTAEIRNIFAKYGELGRIVLPPSGVTGKYVILFNLYDQKPLLLSSSDQKVT